MAQTDLSKLKLARGTDGMLAASGRGRIRRRLRTPLIVGLVVLLGGGFAAYRFQAAPVEVEQASVTAAYPYRSLSVLTATGYVVAQRKAAVASKATGRLEWLGVAEGSRVKQGEVIARLENRDMQAARLGPRREIDAALHCIARAAQAVGLDRVGRIDDGDQGSTRGSAHGFDVLLGDAGGLAALPGRLGMLAQFRLQPHDGQHAQRQDEEGDQ